MSRTLNVTNQDSDVLDVFAETWRAWLDGDADAFAAHYAEDATAILPGIFLPGRDAIRTAMAAAFDGPLKGSRRVHEVRSVHVVGDSVAIVVSQSATVPGGVAEPAADRLEWTTCTLSRQHGRWLIEAIHSCPQAAR